MQPERTAGQAGFTLLEVLVVMMIIGLLAAFVAPSVFHRLDESRRVAAQNQIAIFGTALENYRLDVGQFPTTEQGLPALLEPPSVPPAAEHWNGPYLEKKVPLDPWGHAYVYRCPGDHNPRSYDLYSYGKDGREGGTGPDADVVNW
ncbi:MAG: type II secretion system major pseudopilin GspG [Firmicutes bacterium]|nr:type II secretion system major pseudopilin GspG [Bacillota bacterium]